MSNKANRMWLTKEDVRKLESFCARHAIQFRPRERTLLMQAWNGNLPDNAYKRYKTMLTRLLSHMRSVSS